MTRLNRKITVLINREDYDNDKNTDYNDRESNILIAIVQDGNGKNSNSVK